MYVYTYIICIVHCSSGCQNYHMEIEETLVSYKVLFISTNSIHFILAFHSRIKCMTIRASMFKPMWASLTGGIGSERCGLLRRRRCRSFLLGLEFLDCVGWLAKLPSLIVNRVRAAINQRCGSLHTAFASIAGDVDDFDLRITVFWNDFVPYAILFLPVPGFLSSIYS